MSCGRWQLSNFFWQCLLYDCSRDGCAGSHRLHLLWYPRSDLLLASPQVRSWTCGKTWRGRVVHQHVKEVRPALANIVTMLASALWIDCRLSWRWPLTDFGTLRRRQCGVLLLVQISMTWRQAIDFRILGTLYDPCASKPRTESDYCSMHDHALRQDRALIGNACHTASCTTNTDSEIKRSLIVCMPVVMCASVSATNRSSRFAKPYLLRRAEEYGTGILEMQS